MHNVIILFAFLYAKIKKRLQEWSIQARRVAPNAPGEKLDRRPFLWRFLKKFLPLGTLFWPAPHEKNLH